MPIVSTQTSPLEGGRRGASQCPLWVKSRHRIPLASCPLYPQKRTSFGTVAMSALCGGLNRSVQLSISDRWGDRRDQPAERAPPRLGTFCAGPARPGRCRGGCRQGEAVSAISRRCGRTRPSGYRDALCHCLTALGGPLQLTVIADSKTGRFSDKTGMAIQKSK
jgi:hypothetical protein